MSTIEVWLMAVALAMDCFTISIASGIIQKKITLRPLLLTAILFGLFQALMPVIGWFGAEYFIEYIREFDHWIAFVLLTAVGGKMIWEGVKQDNEATTFNPVSLRVIVMLAVATSIDALAVGISFGCMGMDTFTQILYPVIVIGVVSLLFAVAGMGIGAYAGKKINFRIEPVGGLILIALGVKIVIEHLT